MQIRFKAALAAAIGAMLLAAPSAFAQGVTIHGSHAGMKCETCHAGQTQKAAPSEDLPQVPRFLRSSREEDREAGRKVQPA